MNAATSSEQAGQRELGPQQIPRARPKFYAYAIVVFTNSGCKNDTILDKLNGTARPGYDPTLEDSYRMRYDVEDCAVFLNFENCWISETYMAMREQHIRSGQGFVFFYSVASRADFDQIRLLHEQILAVKRVDSVPAVIVGYDGFKTSERKVTTKEGEGLAKELRCLFVEMDRLRKNEGVFHNLIRELWRHEEEPEASTEKLAEPREKAKKPMRQRLSRLWKR